MKDDEITGAIIGSTFEVYNELGYGFVERVYQRALQVELINRGLDAQLDDKIQVRHKNIIVGECQADLFVEGRIIVELKISKGYNRQDEAQVLNEQKATGVKIGLLINFGQRKVEFKRLIC